MTLNRLHTSQISNTSATDGQELLQYVAANTRVEFVTLLQGEDTLNVTFTPDAKYARLTMSSDQSSIASTTALTTFNTPDIDTSPSNALTSTLGGGKFIIPAGVSKVKLSASVMTPSVTDRVDGSRKNGNRLNPGSTNIDISSTGRDHAFAITGIVDVVENDYFQLYVLSEFKNS